MNISNIAVISKTLASGINPMIDELTFHIQWKKAEFNEPSEGMSSAPRRAASR